MVYILFEELTIGILYSLSGIMIFFIFIEIIQNSEDE